MAYPSLGVAPESRRITRDGREEDETGDGTLRIRKLYADRYDFDLTHPGLSTAELSALASFYNSNVTSSFAYTWPDDGLTYTVRFGKNGFRAEWVGPNRHTAYVRLVAA